MKKILPTDPAHPTLIHDRGQWHTNHGMDIRTEIASRALAGLLANPQNQTNIETSVELAVDAADELIKRLNR